MEISNEWVKFQDVDFADETMKQFHVDTRDFHCIARVDEFQGIDVEKLFKAKCSKFFHTADEVKSLLNRLYEESGGEKEWRCLNLTTQAGWEMKYIRIFRTEYGLVVCNSQNHALNKQILSGEVIQEFL